MYSQCSFTKFQPLCNPSVASFHKFQTVTFLGKNDNFSPVVPMWSVLATML